MRLSTFDKPRVIGCGEDVGKHLALPRGCLADVIELLQSLKIKAEVRDERFAGSPIEAAFHGILREKQQEAVDAIIQHDNGFLCAPTAFGKTAVSAWLIAKRSVNALVLVHRQQLLDQWRERLAMFLNLPIDEIGQIGAGKTKRTGKIDVAVIQSLYRDQEVRDFVAEYGHIIVDECHHLSAVTFEKVIRKTKAKYVIGLTATPTRKSGTRSFPTLPPSSPCSNRLLHHADVTVLSSTFIDDFGMRKLPQTAAEDLLEIVMRRYERASTLLTSNRPVDDWGNFSMMWRPSAPCSIGSCLMATCSKVAQELAHQTAPAT